MKKSGLSLMCPNWVYTTFLVMAFTFSAKAQVIEDKVSELEGVDIVEHIGEYIPLDLVFTNDVGEEVTLATYFDGEQPVLLMLGYYECPMLCNLVFNGIVNSVKNVKLLPGKDYKMVSVSINHREGFELAAAKKANYLTALDIPSAQDGWTFLTGDSAMSQNLANAIGFQYKYIEDIKQYAHPAAIYLLSPDGKISRYLYGVEYKSNDLTFGLLEASEGKIGNTIDRIILYCYHYDPDSKGYVVFAGNVMRLGGAITLILLVGMIGLLFYRERRKKQQALSAAVH